VLIVCFSTAGHPLSMLLNSYQNQAQRCVSSARERLQIPREPAEDATWRMSTLHESLCQSGKNSGFGVTEPHSTGAENMTVRCDEERGMRDDGNLVSEAGTCLPSVSPSLSVSDNSQEVSSSPQTTGVDSHLSRDMAAEIHGLLDQLESDVWTAYDELQNATVSEHVQIILSLVVQGFFFMHMWDDLLTFYRYVVNLL